MTRIVFTVMAAALTLSIACKKQSSEGAAGSGAAGVTGSAAGPATGSAAAAPDTTAATGAGGSAAGAGGSAAATGSGGAAAATGSGGAAAAPDSGGAAMAAGSGSASSEAMAHRAGMCPSTVFGAKTKEAVKGKAVAVTIESTDKDAIKAIQRRTDELLGEKKTHAPTGAAHDQKGTHGGGVGLCPVYVPEGATAKAAHEARGVVVTITPKDKPDELVREIDGRIAKAADWVKANVKEGDKGNQGGVGGGKGDDGSNHSGKGDSKGHERKKGGGGKGTGGGGGGGTGGGGTGSDKQG